MAEQPAPAPHLAHPEGFAALHIARVTVPQAMTLTAVGANVPHTTQSRPTSKFTF